MLKFAFDIRCPLKRLTPSNPYLYSMNRLQLFALGIVAWLVLPAISLPSYAQEEIKALYLHTVQPLPHTWASSEGVELDSAPEALLTHPLQHPGSLQQENKQPLLSCTADGWIQVQAPQGSKGYSLISLYGYLIGESYSKATLSWRSSAPAAVLLGGELLSKQGATPATKKEDKREVDNNTSVISTEKPSTEQDTDINEIQADLKLLPGAHLLQVNLLVEDDKPARVHLCLEHATAPILFYPTDNPATNARAFRPLDLTFMMQTPILSKISPSPNGNYVIVGLRTGYGPTAGSQMMLLDSRGKVLRQDNPLLAHALWHPTEDAFYYTKGSGKKRQLWLHHLSEKQADRLILHSLPEGALTLSPMGDVLFVQETEKAPAKDALAVRFRDPDDRMPDWRDCSQISIISLRNGASMPLTRGSRSVRLVDIHPQDSRVLLATETRDWTRQPFSTSTVIEYNYITGQADTLLSEQVDLVSLHYIPGNEKQLLVIGSPNAFDAIGRTLPTGRIANSFEQELFVYDRASGAARCLTSRFDPSVNQIIPDYGRGFYLLATDRNGKTVHYLNSKSLEIVSLQGVQTPTVKQMGCNRSALWYIGAGPTHADRLYLYPRGGKGAQLIFDLDAQKMQAGYIRPDFHPWSYTSADGSSIDCWYYLPPHFDPARTYPLIVYYYGGTLPSVLGMEGSYSLPMYAAQGYVVLTLNPSGTIGYGQEFAARHLNAWGEPMAREILGATRLFCQEHSFVNAEKIGCMGASYGGFMTQYLQTVDTLFAAAVSHAGISNITNYWGSGYWGIGYNGVAAAGSYPWTRKDLFVERSPLFNAHKIHTPLLLLHGDSDTNVPTAESVNLYNALKVLGREVEMIHFTGQDHFILEPERRIRWTHAIMAWYQRWLKDDPIWWEELPK